ncbi:MAM and LDL-receptor class A domain-containing protein 2 [Halotydeus destructor]|nr:MAM and LDL-receptor class A domain-containing protein 2 [Halotydeus destructor]
MHVSHFAWLCLAVLVTGQNEKDITALDCSFNQENICDYVTYRTSDYRFVDSKKRQVGKTLDGPLSGSTADGYFLEPASSNLWLTSPLIKEQSPFCLSFYYYIHDKIKLALTKSSRDAEGDSEEELWTSVNANTHARWDRKQFELKATGLESSFVLSMVKHEDSTGPAAFDSFLLTPGTCPEPVTCSFDENFCGFTSQHATWFSGWGRLMNPDQVFDNDFQLTLDKRFAYTDNTVSVPTESTELTSELVDSRHAQQCLGFTYFAVRDVELNILSVNTENLGRKIWPTKGRFSLKRNIWTTEEVAFETPDEFRIRFAIENESKKTFLALSDIRLTPGNCSGRVEPVIRQPIRPNDLSCDFENGSCQWKGLQHGEAWKLSNVLDIKMNLKLPLVDHTKQSFLGKYIRVAPEKGDSGAQILEYRGHLDLEPGDYCFSMWSIITGSSSDKYLKFEINSDVSHSSPLIYPIQPSVKWSRSLMAIPVLPSVKYSLYLHCFADENTVIAVDDIEVYSGLCDDGSSENTIYHCSFTDSDCGVTVTKVAGSKTWSPEAMVTHSTTVDHKGKAMSVQLTDDKEHRFWTKTLQADSDACLSFWYKVTTDEREFELKVTLEKGQELESDDQDGVVLLQELEGFPKLDGSANPEGTYLSMGPDGQEALLMSPKIVFPPKKETACLSLSLFMSSETTQHVQFIQSTGFEGHFEIRSTIYSDSPLLENKKWIRYHVEFRNPANKTFNNWKPTSSNPARSWTLQESSNTISISGLASRQYAMLASPEIKRSRYSCSFSLGFMMQPSQGELGVHMSLDGQNMFELWSSSYLGGTGFISSTATVPIGNSKVPFRIYITASSTPDTSLSANIFGVQYSEDCHYKDHDDDVCRDSEEFKCSDGQCVDKRRLCNGVHMCDDGSDDKAGLCDDSARCNFNTFCNFEHTGFSLTLPCNSALRCPTRDHSTNSKYGKLTLLIAHNKPKQGTLMLSKVVSDCAGVMVYHKGNVTLMVNERQVELTEKGQYRWSYLYMSDLKSSDKLIITAVTQDRNSYIALDDFHWGTYCSDQPWADASVLVSPRGLNVSEDVTTTTPYLDQTTKKADPLTSTPVAQDPYVEFECSTGSSIAPHLLCDDVSDCLQGEDESEKECKGVKCGDTGLHCLPLGGTSFVCLDNSKICDGVTDCVDGVDEGGQLCTSADFWCRGFCQNGGQCDNSGHKLKACACANPFTGKRCQRSVGLDESTTLATIAEANHSVQPHLSTSVWIIIAVSVLSLVALTGFASWRWRPWHAFRNWRMSRSASNRNLDNSYVNYDNSDDL